MKTIIAGSRGIKDYDYLCECVQKSTDAGLRITAVVSGTAPGVDRLGERWAEEHGVMVMYRPADWSRHGKRAGFIRNQKMAEEADALIAVWDGVSSGTQHMINVARGLGLEVHKYTRKDGD